MRWICTALFFGVASLWAQSPQSYSRLVNPFIGTGGHGHTFPGAVAPYGMVQLSPDTRIDGSWDGCSGYHYSDSSIYGFSHTHLSGTGCSDYGDILLQPQVGSGNLAPAAQQPQSFSHSQESAQAGYYQVRLDNGIQVELSATERVGFHRYQFPDANGAVLLDLEHRDPLLASELRVYDSVTLVGYRKSKAWANEQYVFFALRFSQAIHLSDWHYDADYCFQRSGDRQALVSFRSPNGQPLDLEVQVALSSTSVEGALNNLRQETRIISSLVSARQHCQAAWDRELSKIQAEWPTGRKQADTVFYTALYHCMIHPSLASDVDGSYRGRDGEIHRAGHPVYTVFSLWDTYRALHPLLGLIDSTRTINFVRSMLLQFEESGLLPVWELASCETNCMIGYHSVSVIADAYLKGIYGYDPYLALRAMCVSSDAKEDDYRYQGYEMGHLDVKKVAESVSKSLEYAYDDWCIARMAEALGQDSIAQIMYRRSERWKNLYNPKASVQYSGFVQPRRNGLFEPFNPYEVNNHYTEANGWQYHFYAPHDIMGMMSTFGGNQAFEAQLDSLFSTRSQTEGREQSDITGLIGQYAHGNEPSHHIAYLYAYTAHPEKGQALIDRICQDFYTNQPDGLIGNEDCGQMSAWYVLSSLGLYSLCPGSNAWVVGSPQVSYARVNRGSLPPLSIRVAQEPVAEGSVWLAHPAVETGQGSALARMDSWLTVSHPNLLYTPTLVFRRSSTEAALLMTPKQKVNTQFVQAPLLQIVGNDLVITPVQGVNGRVKVEWTQGSNKRAFYGDETLTATANGSYILALDGSCTVAVRMEQAMASGGLPGSTQQQLTGYSDWVVYRHQLPERRFDLDLRSAPTPMYAASGPQALVDGILGVEEWRAGDWQGFYDQDLRGTLDLKQRLDRDQELVFRFLSDERAWIFLPVAGNVEYSKNGKSWNQGSGWARSVPDGPREGAFIDEVSVDVPKGTRFVRFAIENYGPLPPWHLGHHDQGRTYIFSDEIQLR